MWNFIDKGPVRAVFIIFAILVLAFVGAAAMSYDLPKPAPGLEAWFKLFQSVVAIVVGLKIAWNIQPIVDALAARIRNTGPG